MSLRDRLTILSQGTEGIPKDQLLSEWVTAVDKLLAMVRRVVKPLIDDRLLSEEMLAMQVTEDAFGTYQISGLRLISGPSSVMFSPGARMIIGSTGRLDVRALKRKQGIRLLRKGIYADSSWEYAVAPATNALLPIAAPEMFDPDTGFRRDAKFLAFDDAAVEPILDFLFTA